MPGTKYISRISKNGDILLMKDSEARTALEDKVDSTLFFSVMNSMEMDEDNGDIYFEYDDGEEEEVTT